MVNSNVIIRTLWVLVHTYQSGHTYSHLSNNRGCWNKHGGSAKIAKSINVEVGISVEGGIFWKNLVHKCNKRGVEGGKNLRNH